MPAYQVFSVNIGSDLDRERSYRGKLDGCEDDYRGEELHVV